MENFWLDLVYNIMLKSDAEVLVIIEMYNIFYGLYTIYRNEHSKVISLRSNSSN